MNGYRWLTDLSQKFLEKDYLLEGQSLDDRVDIICETAERKLNKPYFSGFRKKIKRVIKKGWCSLSTPIWSNFGTDRGLPISCYGSTVNDSMASILETHAEVGMMTKLGGGTAVYFGNLRGRGSPIKNNGESSGSVHFAKMLDTLITTISQGSTRRGNCAAYWPIRHADIREVLTLRTEGSPIQDLSYGVCVDDAWMEDMIAGDSSKRQIWARVLECRANTGYPYLFFTDNVNKNTVDVYRDKGMKINHSQLCTEIFLPTSESESFVCDLASMNDLYFDEWSKDEDSVEAVVYLLDAVMTEFIEKAKFIPFMNRAAKFAERHRAIGIGQLGWHSLLQSKMIAFESMEAKRLNVKVAKTIKDKAYAASKKLAEELGEPEVLRGYGRRHTTLLAIAPTKSSAFILGQVSEGIEPHRSNYFIKDLAKGKFTVKNNHLEELLESKGLNTEEVWNSILKKAGSVQHLESLSVQERAVFKTFAEISQKEIVVQAAQRQQYIDQGQSLNLMIHPDVPIKDVNALIIEAWRLGIKSLYYQISVNAAQQFSRDILSCSSCEA